MNKRIFILIIGMFMLTLPIVFAVTDQDILDLMLFYNKFDTDCITDSTDNANHGTNQGGAFDSGDKHLGAGSCNYADFGDYTIFESIGIYETTGVRDDWGYCLWTKPTTADGFKDWWGRYASPAPVNGDIAATYDDRGSNLIQVRYSDINNENLISTSQAGIEDGSYHLLCGTAVRTAGITNITVWYDGLPKTSITTTDSFAVNTLNITLGRRNPTRVVEAIGRIDEFIYMSPAPDFDEIAYIYNSGTGRQFEGDTTPPRINATTNITTIRINDVINITANVTDETGLLRGKIIHNISGNNISFDFTLSGTDAKFSQNITINLTGGSVINVTAYVEDSSGNANQTEFIFTVTNTAPSFTSASISPNNGKTDQLLTGSTSGYSDADSDSESGSTFKWYKNDVVIGGQTTTSLATSNFIRTDTIKFEATPKDGIDFGSPINSSVSTIADTKASVSIGINNTSPKINEVINVSSNSTDADTLDFCLIKTNQTGAFVNNTFELSGTSGFCSDPVTITQIKGAVINFTIEINDTVGGIIYSNSTIVTVANTLGSITIGKNITLIKINDVINISSNVTDADGNIDFGMVLNNQTGISVNTTFTFNGISSANFSQAIEITVTRGNVINFTVWYNDTFGDIFTNSTILTVQNTIPLQVNIIEPTNKNNNTNITVTILLPTDADGDDLDCYWYLNSSTNPAPVLIASGDCGSTLSVTTTIEDGDDVYNIIMNLSETINISSNLWNFTLDTTFVSIDINNITNNTRFNNKNISWFVETSDLNNFNISAVLFDGSNILQRFHNDTTNGGTTLRLVIPLNLSGLPLSNPQLNITTGDSHSEVPDKIKKGKKGESELIFEDDTIGKNISATVFFREKDNKLTNTPSDLKYQSATNDEGFITWQVNFTVGKPETKIAFNISTTTGDIQILQNTGYKAHLIISPYGMDSEGTLLVNGIEETFTASVTRTAFNAVEVLIIPDVNLAGNDNVSFTSETLFGLNVKTTTYDLSIVKSVAVEGFDIVIDEIDLDSSTFTIVANVTLNSTVRKNITIRGDGLLQKLSNDAASTMTMRVKVNGIIQFEQEILTINNLFERKPYTIPPFQVEVVEGINNISIEEKEDGDGSLNQTSFEFHIDSDRSNENNKLTTKVSDTTITFSSTSFINILNFSIDKPFNSSTSIDIHHTLSKTGTGSSTSNCYIQNFNTSERSVTDAIFLKDNTVIESSGINLISKTPFKGVETWQVFCKSTNNDNILNNMTVYLLDMVDSSENEINHFQNETTTNQSFSGNNNKIVQFNDFEIKNGTQIEIFGSVYFQSLTGGQNGSDSPIIYFNSSASTRANCFHTFQRSLLNNNDVGTVKFYANCDNVAVGEKHNFTIYTDLSGSNIIKVLNASLSGYESEGINLTTLNIPPLVSITEPKEGANVSGTITIEYGVTELNNFTVNISLSNVTNNTIIASNLGKEITSFVFDTTLFADGFYNLTITAFENDTVELFSDNETHNIFIDNTAPSINILLPVNGTSTTTALTNITWNVTDSLNFNCTMQVDDNILFNQTGLSSGQFSNITTLSLATHKISVNCTDTLSNSISVFHTITITSPPPSAPPPSRGGFTSGTEAGTVILASEIASMNQDLCELSSSFAWFDTTCYECEGKIMQQNEDLVCISCNEGFVLVGTECKPTSPETSTLNFNILDRLLNKISPENPAFGLAAIALVGIILVMGYNNREIIRRKFKKTFL